MIVAWQEQGKNFSEFHVGTKQLPLHHFLCQLFQVIITKEDSSVSPTSSIALDKLVNTFEIYEMPCHHVSLLIFRISLLHIPLHHQQQTLP